MAYQDYGSHTTITGTFPAQAVQPQGEIAQRLDALEKTLHELQEEAVGLGGTFALVLRPSLPQASGSPNDAMKSPVVSPTAERVELCTSQVVNAVQVLRDIRSRCDL
jgi:hypothetical protein